MLTTKCTFLPDADKYAVVIAAALRREVISSGLRIKTLMRWTGAGESTVKNWLGAVRGPSGPHLLALAMYSTEVHSACLLLSGRAREQIENKASAIRLLTEVMVLLADAPIETELGND